MFVGLRTSLRDIKLLGNKGLKLVEMTAMGFPVPEGFIAVAGVPLDRQLFCIALAPYPDIEFSVRSSAPVSLPGMMDSFLNVKGVETILEKAYLVRESWNNKRAVEYRKMLVLPRGAISFNQISEDLPVAVIIQKMVYGNKENSGTGVVFTRNPITGEKGLWGDWLPMAQGNELVMGLATPQLLTSDLPFYQELANYAYQLERFYQEMQDIEFTVESGKLWLLQTRDGKRHEDAVIPILRGLYRDGIIGLAEMRSRYRAWCRREVMGRVWEK